MPGTSAQQATQLHAAARDEVDAAVADLRQSLSIMRLAAFKFARERGAPAAADAFAHLVEHELDRMKARVEALAANVPRSDERFDAALSGCPEVDLALCLTPFLGENSPFVPVHVPVTARLPQSLVVRVPPAFPEALLATVKDLVGRLPNGGSAHLVADNEGDHVHVALTLMPRISERVPGRAAPAATSGVWRALADLVEAHGGALWFTDPPNAECLHVTLPLNTPEVPT